MREFFDKREAALALGVFFALISALFFGSTIITSSQELMQVDLINNLDEKVIFLGKISDNLVITSDDEIDGRVFVVVRYVDGTESEPISVGLSGTSNSQKGYTSDLLTFENFIDKVTIYSKETETISIDKLNDGIYALFRFEGAVLGLTSEAQRDEVLFLEKNDVKVVSRDDWDEGFDRDLVEDGEYVDIQGIDVFPVENLSAGSDLEKVRAVGDFQKLRCKDVPGIAPISCEKDEIMGEISYNYIVASNGVVYQGLVGGNGIAGTHNQDRDNNISVAILADNEGEYNQVENIQKLLLSLSIVNDFEYVKENVFFNNTLDGENFEQLGKDVFSVNEKIIAKNKEKVAKVKETTKKVFVNENIVRSGDGIQLLVSKDSSDAAKKVVTRMSDSGSVGDQYESVFVNQEIAQQVITEAKIIDENAKIQPNYIYKLNSWDNTDVDRTIPSDYNTLTHWNLEKIQTPEAWKELGGCVADNTCGGDGAVKVAVLDTGVAYENYNFDGGGSYSVEQFDPFFVEIPSVETQNGIYNEGYDREYTALPEFSNISFVDPYDSWQDYSCNVLRLSGTNPDACNTFELDKIDHANDDHGHGTFVTGIIAANTSDAAPNKVVGIAHNIQIMPIKVFTPNDVSMCQDEFGQPDASCSYAYGDYRSVAFTTTIVDGIDHAVSNGAKVINMSLGGPGTDTFVDDAITNADTAGTLVVVSSGNDNDDTQYYFPANAQDAYTVGSTDSSDNRAAYSNYGFELDLVAPVGDSVGARTSSIRYFCSTDGTCDDETDSNLFKTFSSTSTPNTGIGTSYASPQVAAAAALLWSDDPTATVAEIKNALNNSATDLGDVGYDQYFGYGMLNIDGALNREQNVPVPVKQYFPWYDASDTSKQAWILVGNPSSTENANISINIGGEVLGNFSIPPGDRVTPQWRGVRDGPVIITSNIDVYASQRVVFQGSFNEYSAIKEADLANKYYYTWYDSIDTSISTWVLVANPSDTSTANVTITIGGTLMGTYVIAPGERVTPLWRGLRDGPVVVSSDINVITSQRVLFKGSFNEYPGIVITP